MEKGNLHLTICDVFFINLATRASGMTPAEWSLKVAEFDKGHRGIFGPFEVTCLADQIGHQFFCAGTVGLDLGGIGAEFSRLSRQADLVLAKGMGHFETMCGLDDPRIFFLLQTKCGAVAQAFVVPRWSLIFQRLSG